MSHDDVEMALTLDEEGQASMDRVMAHYDAVLTAAAEASDVEKRAPEPGAAFSLPTRSSSVLTATEISPRAAASPADRGMHPARAAMLAGSGRLAASSSPAVNSSSPPGQEDRSIRGAADRPYSGRGGPLRSGSNDTPLGNPGFAAPVVPSLGYQTVANMPRTLKNYDPNTEYVVLDEQYRLQKLPGHTIRFSPGFTASGSIGHMIHQPNGALFVLPVGWSVMETQRPHQSIPAPQQQENIGFGPSKKAPAPGPTHRRGSHWRQRNMSGPIPTATAADRSADRLATAPVKITESMIENFATLRTEVAKRHLNLNRKQQTTLEGTYTYTFTINGPMNVDHYLRTSRSYAGRGETAQEASKLAVIKALETMVRDWGRAPEEQPSRIDGLDVLPVARGGRDNRSRSPGQRLYNRHRRSGARSDARDLRLRSRSPQFGRLSPVRQCSDHYRPGMVDHYAPSVDDHEHGQIMPHGDVEMENAAGQEGANPRRLDQGRLRDIQRALSGGEGAGGLRRQ